MNQTGEIFTNYFKLSFFKLNFHLVGAKPKLESLPLDDVKSTSFSSLNQEKSTTLNISTPQKHKSSNIKNNFVCEDKVQTELLEIINDFKNNVHSIAQAEKLVEEWKNRNDVQKSFKEKQEQLNEMRLKYEKIQQEMKNNTKRLSPFERVKKIFTRSRVKEDKKEILQSQNVTIIPSQRPISSLSLQSTSSKFIFNFFYK